MGDKEMDRNEEARPEVKPVRRRYSVGHRSELAGCPESVQTAAAACQGELFRKQPGVGRVK
jgi:hypothetical protein